MEYYPLGLDTKKKGGKLPKIGEDTTKFQENSEMMLRASENLIEPLSNVSLKPSKAQVSALYS